MRVLGYRSLIEASEASGTATELDSNDPPVAEPEGTASDDGSYEGEVDEMEQNLINHFAPRREGETFREYEGRVNTQHISEPPIGFPLADFRASDGEVIRRGLLHELHSPQEPTRFNLMLLEMAQGNRPLPAETSLAQIQERIHCQLAPLFCPTTLASEFEQMCHSH